MTEDRDEHARRVRRLADRLRRRRRALERRNPLKDLQSYREGFREVVRMQAQLRDLERGGPGAGEPPDADRSGPA